MSTALPLPSVDVLASMLEAVNVTPRVRACVCPLVPAEVGAVAWVRSGSPERLTFLVHPKSEDGVRSCIVAHWVEWRTLVDGPDGMELLAALPGLLLR